MRDICRITKSLTNNIPNIPPLTFNGKVATAIQEKANDFTGTLQQAFTTNLYGDRSFTVILGQIVNDFLKEPLTDRLKATKYSELASIVPHFKLCKMAGPDGIQNIILQHPKLIVTILSRSLTPNYFPAYWKEAKIITLPKPGKDHTSPLNYRPISLLNSLGKLLRKSLWED
jgi:hypothetical protein